MFNVLIKKRSGNQEDYDRRKVFVSIKKAFSSTGKPVEEAELNQMVDEVEQKLLSKHTDDDPAPAEQVQNLIELTLMDKGHFEVLKAYILYRSKYSNTQKAVNQFAEYIKDEDTLAILKSVKNDYAAEEYSLDNLFEQFASFIKEGMTERDYIAVLTQASSELIDQNAPDWEYISSRFMVKGLYEDVKLQEQKYNINSFYDKINFLTEQKLYGDYILKNYNKENIDELEQYMDKSRDSLLTYSSLSLLKKRYLIKMRDFQSIETPQEMFMGIAMHLAMPEGANRVIWAKNMYDVLSKLQLTVATPTMANARKPYPQLSSCFVDTVPDSLEGIYRSITDFAQVSKFGGGMGMYFGKVRASGSDIRGHKGAAGGTSRWIKLANDTAVAVDQLGVRQGSVCVYLDVWHRDIPEFLQLRTNNGDDRIKAHDVFPAVCYPDLFWKLAKENPDAVWNMMDPHQILKVKGYALEDSYGEEWETKYNDCVADPAISKRTMPIKDLLKLIIKSLTETGTPFCFNRDTANRMNPNKHKGIIYSSNLCTEIMQNTSAIQTVSTTISDNNGDMVVVTKTKPGDFAICNLASIVLGNIDLNNDNELQFTIETAVRALDNVIDLNFYPLPYAEITGRKYRAIGLGTSGYHEALIKKGIRWSDEEEHMMFANVLYEKINYLAISASMKIAAEKGSYSYFEGSEWQSGKYFARRGYTNPAWQQLQEQIRRYGLRNAYIMAVAPTGSTSIIAGTTASTDPILKRYFLEEKKGGIMPRVAPNLNKKTFLLYENAHEIDQKLIIRAAGIRQRHIDQSQSVNIYITPDYTMKQLLELYIQAWEEGLKSIYYVRSKALTVEECEVCSS